MATWTRNLELPKDPYAEDDYLFEWGDFLNGSNIASTLVEGANCVVASYSIVNLSQDVTCRITGGTLAELDATTVSCKVTTDDVPARKDKRTVTLDIVSL